MRSVSYLLFTSMGQLVSHHSVIFFLLVHHLNLLIFPFLSIFHNTLYSIEFQDEEGEEAKIHQATGGEGQS